MAKPYKASNGRVIQRSSKGRFRKTNLSDFGISHDLLQNGRAICGVCNYGAIEKWYPVLKTGHCPKCNSEEKIHPLAFQYSSLKVSVLKVKEEVENTVHEGKNLILMNEDLYSELAILSYENQFAIFNYKGKGDIFKDTDKVSIIIISKDKENTYTLELTPRELMDSFDKYEVELWDFIEKEYQDAICDKYREFIMNE